MTTLVAWLHANYKWLGPLVVYALNNIANGLISHPEVATWIHRAIDFISLVTHSDSPGTWKAPFTASLAPTGSRLELPDPVRAGVFLPWLALPFIGALVSSCLCWQPEHRQDIGCVVLHQVIDCTTGETPAVIAAVIKMIMPYISGGSPDWSDIAARAESLGLKDGGCVLAALESDFVNKVATSGHTSMVLPHIMTMMDNFKTKHQLQGVRFKIPGGHLL